MSDDDYEELVEEQEEKERKKRRRLVFNIISFFVLEFVFAGAVLALLYWQEDLIPQISPTLVLIISGVVNLFFLAVFFLKGRRGPGWGHRGGWRRNAGGGWGHRHGGHRQHHHRHHRHRGRHR